MVKEKQKRKEESFGPPGGSTRDSADPVTGPVRVR